MDCQIKTRALSSLENDMVKNKFDFNHHLQRNDEIWDTNTKALYIDTLLRNYPVLPIMLLKENNAVIDGKQRLTVTHSFLNDGFKLRKDLPSIDVDGMEFPIANKKFSELDVRVKDRLLNREIETYILFNATEQDVRNIFARINSATGLTNTQRRTTIESDELASVISDLKNHPFILKCLTKAQIKKDINKDVIRQTLMLVDRNKDYHFTDFKNKSINDFIKYYNDKINQKDIDAIKTALDTLNENIDTKIILLSLPMVIYGMVYCVKFNKPTDKYIEWLKGFLNTYAEDKEYSKYIKGGTAAKDMVYGRYNYFRNVVKGL